MVLELPIKELTVKYMSTESFQNDASVTTILFIEIGQFTHLNIEIPPFFCTLAERPRQQTLMLT